VQEARRLGELCGSNRANKDVVTTLSLAGTIPPGGPTMDKLQFEMERA